VGGVGRERTSARRSRCASAGRPSPYAAVIKTSARAVPGRGRASHRVFCEIQTLAQCWHSKSFMPLAFCGTPYAHYLRIALAMAFTPNTLLRLGYISSVIFPFIFVYNATMRGRIRPSDTSTRWRQSIQPPDKARSTRERTYGRAQFQIRPGGRVDGPPVGHSARSPYEVRRLVAARRQSNHTGLKVAQERHEMDRPERCHLSGTTTDQAAHPPQRMSRLAGSRICYLASSPPMTRP